MTRYEIYKAQNLPRYKIPYSQWLRKRIDTWIELFHWKEYKERRAFSTSVEAQRSILCRNENHFDAWLNENFGAR